MKEKHKRDIQEWQESHFFFQDIKSIMEIQRLEIAHLTFLLLLNFYMFSPDN